MEIKQPPYNKMLECYSETEKLFDEMDLNLGNKHETDN